MLSFLLQLLTLPVYHFCHSPLPTRRRCYRQSLTKVESSAWLYLAYLNTSRALLESKESMGDDGSVLSSLGKLVPHPHEHHIQDCQSLGRKERTGRRSWSFHVAFNCASDVVNIVAKYHLSAPDSPNILIKPPPLSRVKVSWGLAAQRAVSANWVWNSSQSDQVTW